MSGCCQGPTPIISIGGSSVSPLVVGGAPSLGALLRSMRTTHAPPTTEEDAPAPPTVGVPVVVVNQTPLVMDLGAAASWTLSATSVSTIFLYDYVPEDFAPFGQFTLNVRRLAWDGVPVEPPVVSTTVLIVFSPLASDTFSATFSTPVVATLPRGKYQLSGALELVSQPLGYSEFGAISLYATATVTHAVA